MSWRAWLWTLWSVSLLGIVVIGYRVMRAPNVRSREIPTAPLQTTTTSDPIFRLEGLDDIRQFQDGVPRKGRVREEVELDPHSVPESLVSFALQVGKWMGRAKDDGAVASLLMDQLEWCTEQEDAVDSARAFCLRQIQRLSALHPDQPELKLRAQSIAEIIPPRVREIADGAEG